MRLMEWEIKVSKLCNLRCKYCYEFDELADPRVISIENWRSILESARWYHEELVRKNPGEEVRTSLNWHGGEPLLLPLEYFERVLALQREVLGGEATRRAFWNNVTTNLYDPPWETIDLLQREGFNMNVSFDLAPGARITAGGRETERRVRRNLEQLLEKGWRTQVSTVVASHDAGRLGEIYDALREVSARSDGEIYLNFIPLYETAWSRGAGASREDMLESDPATIVDALFRLFNHWLEDSDAVDTSPVAEYLDDVLMKRRGSPRTYYDRRGYGESLLVVNTDGELYVLADCYERSKSLGCLFETSFQQILRSGAYAASLEREEALVARYCDGCPYDGYCSRQPIFHGHREHPGRHCSVVYPLLCRIEEAVIAKGFASEEVQAALRDNTCS